MLKDTFGVNGTILDWDSDHLQGGGKIINRHLFKIKANQNFFINPGKINDNVEGISSKKLRRSIGKNRSQKIKKRVKK